MLEVVEKDLFGNEAGTLSPGEFLVVSHILSKQWSIVSRAEWCLENLPQFDPLLLDLEDGELLSDAFAAYIFGLYSTVIIAADGFGERILTDLIESWGDHRSARSGMGAVLRSMERHGRLHPFVLARIRRHHAIRNNLCHEKGPDSPLRLFRRSLVEGSHHQAIMKADAQEALCIMRGIAGLVKRTFPRLDLPGSKRRQGQLL